MQKTLVITVLATDRPGIVHNLSEVLIAHNANWTDSRMSSLAGKFAGLLQISVAEDKLDGLKASLQSLQQADNGLQIQMEDASNAEPVESPRELHIELIGQDRPGIVDDITRTLAKLKVNINELESENHEASMSSELLFFARLSLGISAETNDDDVRDALEALQDQLMVDIQFLDAE